MTHGARGNFLAFKAAPPSLHRTLDWRQYPRKQKAKPVAQCFAVRAAPSLWVPAVARRRCSLSLAKIYSTIKSCIKTSWEHFSGNTSFLLVAERNPKPALLFLSPPKVSHQIACFANRSQLCNGLDESVLLRTDILGTHWIALRPYKNAATHQKHIIEINMPLNSTQTLRGGRQMRRKWRPRNRFFN